MFGFYVILTLAFLYIAFMGSVIGYLIGKYWKKKQRMKFRLAKKIMKQARHLSTASDYWYRRLRDFEYKICYGFVGKKRPQNHQGDKFNK